MNQADDRSPTGSRRRFLATGLGLGLGWPLIGPAGHRVPGPMESFHPFSPDRTVILPRRLGRGHLPARRAIERKVEELAGMDLRRVPGPKIEALLQVADAVTCHYGVGHRLEEWAVRIPIQEAFCPMSFGNFGYLSNWQPREPVPGAGDPLDWWLFLSPGPIEWGGLDGLPVHALVAHVSPINYHEQIDAMCWAWSNAGRLGSKVAEGHQWDRLARMRPLDAVRLLNEVYRAVVEERR